MADKGKTAVDEFERFKKDADSEYTERARERIAELKDSEAKLNQIIPPVPDLDSDLVN